MGFFIYVGLQNAQPSRGQILGAMLHPAAAFTFATLSFTEWEGANIGVSANTWNVSNQYAVTFQVRPSFHPYNTTRLSSHPPNTPLASPAQHNTPLVSQDCLNFMLIDTVWILVLAWYVANVFPSEYGTQQPPWFLFTPEYWATVCWATNPQCCREEVKRGRERELKQLEMQKLRAVAKAPAAGYGYGEEGPVTVEPSEPAEVPIEPVSDVLRRQVEIGHCVPAPPPGRSLTAPPLPLAAPSAPPPGGDRPVRGHPRLAQGVQHAHGHQGSVG